MAKKRIVIGNWKMYVESVDEAKAFATVLRRKMRTILGVDAMLAPSYPLIPVVEKALESSPVRVGAQALSSHHDGARTGDVSGKTLKNVGASFVIVGHSERRAMGEGDTAVRAQVEQALAAGLTVVLCVGEHEREENGEHFSFIAKQLGSALENLPKGAAGKVIVAYEPVWAIGKEAKDAMQPSDLEEMHIFIKKTIAECIDRKAALRIPILYGGSVDGSNAGSLLSVGGISGFLVGRASTHIDTFIEIITACRR